MYHIKEADIAIIGGGAAGAMTAIYAHRMVPRIVIAIFEKRKRESSGTAGQ